MSCRVTMVDMKASTASGEESPTGTPVSPVHRKENLEWRRDDDDDEENGEKKPKASSRGVSPQRFHSFRRRPRSAWLDSIREHYINNQKSRVSQELEVKRSAFRQVTCLKTHPLQELALVQYRELLHTHLQLPCDSSSSGAAVVDSSKASANANASSASSSSASSSSSVISLEDADVERKRPLRDMLLSPAKSRLKTSYRNDFLVEQSLARPIPVQQHQDVFGSALWSTEPRVWSVEKRGGKRKYITSHFGRFADLYWRQKEPTSRHYYEVILEQTPCRLYLDLEFSYNDATTASTTDLTEQLMEELFAELQVELQTVFPQEGVLNRNQVVDLDSSTSTKFSRHWIVHMTHLFAHTAAVGQFVTNWIGRLANEHAAQQLAAKGKHALQSLLFQNDNKDCVVDLGVYTRNRLFRLLGSRKYGKHMEAVLRVADRNQFPLRLANSMFYPPSMKPTEEGTRDKCEDVDVDEKVEHATDWSVHAQALADTLVIPLNSSKIDFPILPYDETGAAAIGCCPQPRNLASRRSNTTIQRGTSPYSMLDDFVEKVLGMRGCEEGFALPGSIRAWSVERGTNNSAVQVTYQMCRNRWCEHIQRAHKGNNIYWVVDLAKFTCTQACHDPDCRSFRGLPVPLPDTIRQELSEILFEEALAALNLDDPAQQARDTSKSALDDDDSLSDETLLHAVLEHPEMFP